MSGTHSSVREWLKVLVLSLFIAIIFKSCVFDVFTIPTSSMIYTLVPGDVILVNKISIGAKTANTPLTLPFMHKYIPFTAGKKCYTDILRLPSFRLPGWSEIKRNDILVFHYPMDDLFPIDHREYFVKRCIGLPGDHVQLSSNFVVIEGEIQDAPEHVAYPYIVETKAGIPMNFDSLTILEGGKMKDENHWELILDKKLNDELSADDHISSVTSISPDIREIDNEIFPVDVIKGWNRAFVGPIYVPASGDTIPLSVENIPYYKRIIETYESHQLEVSPEGDIFIDKVPAPYYIFEQNYYYVLGDNRSNSSDSRYWGFLPEDHIVGRASLILYSAATDANGDRNLRWNRILKTPE